MTDNFSKFTDRIGVFASPGSNACEIGFLVCPNLSTRFKN